MCETSCSAKVAKRVSRTQSDCLACSGRKEKGTRKHSLKTVTQIDYFTAKGCKSFSPLFRQAGKQIERWPAERPSVGWPDEEVPL